MCWMWIRPRHCVGSDGLSADPLIVSALLGPEDFAWLDRLRRAHFPPDRNRLPAHLTLFHHLPPSLGAELRQRLGEIARAPRPHAEAAGLIDLGGGAAIRIVSPELEAMRADLAYASPVCSHRKIGPAGAPTSPSRTRSARRRRALSKAASARTSDHATCGSMVLRFGLIAMASGRPFRATCSLGRDRGDAQHADIAHRTFLL